jgi:hypothetical protein
MYFKEKLSVEFARDRVLVQFTLATLGENSQTRSRRLCSIRQFDSAERDLLKAFAAQTASPFSVMVQFEPTVQSSAFRLRILLPITTQTKV